MKTHTKKTLSSIALLLIITLVLCSFVFQAMGESPEAAKKEKKIKHSKEPGTPFQRGLKKGIEKRQGEGKPHPHAEYEFTLVEDGIYANGTGITRLEFDDPGQAGLLEWPDFIVESSPAHNYTEDLIDKYPDLYGPDGLYTFGEEPRNYTVIEYFNITSPEPISSSSSGTSTNLLSSASTSTTTRDILMGFTLAPPKIDWTIGTDVSVFGFTIFAAKAGFKLDVAFGLRLPVEVSMTSPDLMTVEHSYPLSTSLTPLNWAAADYASAGVLAEGGNEFVCRLSFFLGVKVTIAEVDVIDWSLGTEQSLSKDFTTPFGVGAEFPIPALELEPSDTGLQMSWVGASIGIGLRLDPDIGSKTIRADWSASGDASGSGSIEYHEPDASYPFGPVYADNLDLTTDYADISLSDFEYVFDICKITIGARIDLGGWLAFVPDLPWFDLFTFDLSDFTAALSLGVHDDTPGTVDTSIFVQNFGIDVSVTPDTVDVEPGYWGTYTVSVTNLGNVPDTFDTFSVEGLPSNWEYTLSESSVSLDPGESTNLELRIKPWRHYTTSPGDYPFTVRGDSEGAKLWELVRTDSDDAVVHALQFFEPGISIEPRLSTVKPGETASYAINVSNFGNDVDSFELTIQYLDFGALYRAVPTYIQLGWTSIDNTLIGPLDPGEYDIATLTISVPSTWAGMEDTTYEFEATATSLGDTTHIPPASNTDTAGLTVEATKESMARYIDLELQWLTNEVEASGIEEDIRLSLLDKLTEATIKKEQALNHILRGKEKTANNMLKACIGMMSAFENEVYAQVGEQPGKHIPEALAESWIAQAEQIVADLATTIATPIQN